jgi:hypothetical protein
MTLLRAYNRTQIVEQIMAIVGRCQGALNFRRRLESLEDEQLNNFYSNLLKSLDERIGLTLFDLEIIAMRSMIEEKDWRRVGLIAQGIQKHADELGSLK